MDTEVAERSSNPFAGGVVATRPSGALAQAESQRGVAEVQARMMIARANPRDPIQCMDAILQDCMRPTLAEAAVYQYSRGGSDVSGPSIKLAESIARRWGNIASGIKEVSRSGGYSECIAYAWDLETGYYDERQFQVRHWRDTKAGGYALKDERDIYELTANMGQRRKRAVLLSVIPGDVVEAAVKQCELTMHAKADTSPEAIQKMLAAFEPFGVTKEQIEKRIQRRMDAITAAQVVGLKKVYASLRDGMSSPADWFEMPEGSAAAAAGTASDALKSKLRKKAAPAEEASKQAGAVDEATGEIAPAAQQAQQQTEGNAPTLSDALALARAGDYDAAVDIANGLDANAQTEIQNEISRLKKAAK